MSDYWQAVAKERSNRVEGYAVLIGQIEVLAENPTGLDPAEVLARIRAAIAEHDAEVKRHG